MSDPSQSVLRKVAESVTTKQRFFEANAARVVACAADLARAFDAGGKMFVMGNGGSACDAEHAAVEFMHPILEKRARLPAVALSAGSALMTAVGNDRDFALVHVEPLRALGKKADVALGISTSGASANVNRALQAAREMGMLTIGMTGKDGGRMRDLCDHLFHVESYSIHRIQETHVTLLHVLWDMVHVQRGEDDVTG